MPKLTKPQTEEALRKCNVEFNKLGIPKKGREKMVSKLDVLAISKCPFGAKNWKVVSQGVKGMIFKEIRVTKVYNSL